MTASVPRQVRSDKAAFTGSHVAAGASRLAEENCLSSVWIPGQIKRCLCSLQRTQVCNYGLDVSMGKGVEGRHSSSRPAILDDVRNLSIGKPLHFGIFRNVGRSLAAFAVQTVASGAG